MKIKPTWLSIISLLHVVTLWGQDLEEEVRLQANGDLAEEPKTYALRLGLDLLKPISVQFDNNYQGIELVGDLRINQRIYIASEIGSEKRTQQSELLNFSTQGSYIKLGIDYNFFNNWKGMNNAIYIGMRYGQSIHTHTVNHYRIYQLEQYFESPKIREGFLTGEREQLSSSWFELLFGIKVQLLPNLYGGISLRVHRILANPQPTDFGNLYAPGFNKITDQNNFGASYNYTLSYSFPFRFKREKN
jgi:hypothetical protein